MKQLEIDYEGPQPLDNYALWTPRDIWVRLDQSLLEFFAEDRRLERKDWRKPSLEELAIYLSVFSNTPEGGLLVYGVVDRTGEVVGCDFTTGQLNEVERAHITHCPKAKPEFKRVPVVVDGVQKFVLAVFAPYVGVLVETHKGEAWIRYGESKRKMSEEEKNDFRATRKELSFELTPSIHEYPSDFDLRVIQDFCDAYRTRELRPDWTNEDVLVDRHLLKQVGKQYQSLNSLVLMAAKDPALTIPGCRVRIQRFGSISEGSGEKYAPLRDRMVEGHLVKILQEAQEVISSLIYDVTWLNAEGKFETTPEYPQKAWFEALVNACVHRSYSFSGTEITVKIFPDRMEIESPGGFVPPVNEQTIYDIRASRNHHLMDALRFLGYVRMAREGTRRIRDSMREYQLPEPVFKQEALHGLVVRVTLKNDQETHQRASDKDVAQHFGVALWKQLEPYEIKIAAHAFRNSTIQVSEAQHITGRSWGTSKRDLDRLVTKGVLTFQPGRFVRDPKALYRVVTPVISDDPSQ